jgi:hypothetical protein
MDEPRITGLTGGALAAFRTAPAIARPRTKEWDQFPGEFWGVAPERGAEDRLPRRSAGADRVQRTDERDGRIRKPWGTRVNPVSSDSLCGFPQ